MFKEINKLSVPIRYMKSTYEYGKPLLMIFGEMGNGKSTTGNAIIKDQCNKMGVSFKKELAFKASKDT